MSNAYSTSTPANIYDQQAVGAIQPDVSAVAINWFVNRTPLATRLIRTPLASTSFIVISDNFRSTSQLINNGGTVGSGDTTMVVTDSTEFSVGDVVEAGTEQILITAIVTSTHTLTITRGYAGTTAATHADASPIYLIGTAATGQDVATDSLSRIPKATTSYAQTIQHVYKVGGSLATVANYFSAYGTPLDRDRMQQLQNCVDDMERAFVYGVAKAAASATDTRQQMAGVRAQCITNKTLSPTNAAAYKPSDLVRDTIQKCFDGGGNPSSLIVSTDFLTGLAIWGYTPMRISAGPNTYGVEIKSLTVPFLGEINIIPSPLLRPGTVLCLTGPEVRIREKRKLFEKPRGSRGDAVEGDFIWEGGIEVDNEAHHAFVSGITAFAAP